MFTFFIPMFFWPKRKKKMGEKFKQVFYLQWTWKKFTHKYATDVNICLKCIMFFLLKNQTGQFEIINRFFPV